MPQMKPDAMALARTAVGAHRYPAYTVPAAGRTRRVPRGSDYDSRVAFESEEDSAARILFAVASACSVLGAMQV